MIAPGGITPFWIGSGQLYSTVVQEAIDQYSGLSAKDLAFINTLITLEGSNYDLYDEFFPYILGSNVEANGSIGLKGTTGTPTNDPTFDIGGLLFDGVDQYFDTTLAPDALTKASQNDIDVQCFVKDNLNIADTKVLFGIFASGKGLELFEIPSTPSFVYTVNSTSGLIAASSGGFQDNTMYGIGRDEAVNMEMYVGGVEFATGAKASALPDVSMFVGARNTGIADILHINAKVSTLKMGAAIGFSQSIHNSSVRTALAGYGSI